MSFDRLGQQVAREQDSLRARSSDRARARSRLLRGRAVPERPRLVPRVAIGVGVLAAVIALGVLVAQRPLGLVVEPRQPAQVPLAVQLDGSSRSLGPGDFVQARADETLAMRFSDGTRVRMAEGARVRLVEIGASGAHLLLESGEARVEVAARPQARWRLSAGPFAVRVTGTRFDVRWQPQEDRFELELTEGSVEVAGCVLGEGYRMHAGQRVHASCRRGQFDVTELATSSPQPARVEKVADREEAVAPERTASEGDRERAQRTQAKPSFEQRCEQASAAALARMADAAHRAGASRRESHALRVLRRRFAGTTQAALAAFALGRLEADIHGDQRKAAQWFGTYLREQPTGPLSREARGRLIEAALDRGLRARARELAAAYLRDHPEGPHARLARGLLQHEAQP